MGSRSTLYLRRSSVVIGTALGLLVATMQLSPTATAAGPPYSGPVTALSEGPAYFGPAPNPIPYCDNPTYFDPFPENVNPIGEISVDPAAPEASVTTDNITMNFDLTAEGDITSQYPGFFPYTDPMTMVTQGGASDQPKGVEMASGDAAVVTLSEPLFYSQWVFTDVDRLNEGFLVTPAWTGSPGAVVLSAGKTGNALGNDNDPTRPDSPPGEFDFTGTTTTTARFTDTDPTVNEKSGSIKGRVQVDFIGAVTGITMEREPGNGQSGFAVGGGCSPIGIAKEVTSGPTWNGSTYDVTFTFRVRNNLPSTQTLSDAVTAAVAASNNSATVGTVEGIALADVQIADFLDDAAFDTITVQSLTSVSGLIDVNDEGFDGVNDINLLASGASIPGETEEEFVLVLEYTPDQTGPLGPTCATSYTLNNSATVTADATGVAVSDQSDDGADPDPGVDNGAGGVDDPTPVAFPCAPAGLEIVKTVVAGPAGTCPGFADGIVGDGPPLPVTEGDTVTYCISVFNPELTAATAVTVADPQAPVGFDGAIGTLPAGTEATVSFDLTVDDATPVRNTATATGTGPQGPLGPVDDTALIDVSPPPVPAVAITKTVVADGGSCAEAAEGVDELVVGELGDPVTWCIVVTNTGETPLTDLVIDDPLAGIAGLDLLATHGAGAPALLVGESITFSVAGTVLDEGAVNTVSVEGAPSDPDGNVLPDLAPVNDDNDAAVGEVGIELDKTVVAGPLGDCASATEEVTVLPGTTVTYCFTVTNTGSTDLVVAEVVDATLDLTVPLPAASQLIAPAASVTVAIDVDAVSIENTASVTGTPVDPAGDPIPDTPNPTDEDTARVVIPVPSISVTKTVVVAGDSCGDAVEGIDEFVVTAPGDLVTWCIVITNDGDVPLSNVVLDDPVAGIDDVTVVASPNVLAVGAQAVVTVDDVVPAEGAVNVATVSAVPSNPDGTPIPEFDPVDDSNTAAVAAADVELSKTVVAGANGDCSTAVDEVTAPQGTIVTYCFTVTNTGSIDLLVAEVADATLGITVPIPSADRIILPGGQVTVAAEVAATPLTNTASVEGIPTDGAGDPVPGPRPTATDTAVVLTQVPMLDLVKTVVRGPNGSCPSSLAQGVAGSGDALTIDIGATVTYCINVANTGELDIDNVTVSDPMAPAGAIGNLGTLAQGTETVVSFDLVVDSATPLVNTASVTGDDPAGGQLPPDSDTALIERAVPDPAITVTKTVVAGSGGDCAASTEQVAGDAGDPVTWCISVRNTGNVPLSDIVVDDELIGLVDVDLLGAYGGGAAVLAVGDAISFTVTGTIPAGGLTNVVAAVARPADPDGTPLAGLPTVDDSDDANVVERRADLRLVKSVSDRGPVTVGELLTYTLVIVNDGPDAAADVSVADVLPAGIRVVELPALDGWTCATTDRGFFCDRTESMPAGATDTLSYTAVTTSDAGAGRSLQNVATVTTSTIDPTPDNNSDRATTTTPAPPVVFATTTSPPLASPTITNAPPAPAPVPTAPPLALTGTESMLLTAVAALLIGVGGGLEITARRRRHDRV